jgi:hypothetical protein
LEIEVLDPNADPLGNPAVELRENDRYCDGSLTVEIPPVVIVHKYYYTGDRCFQGPMLPGGPSIVVLNHPKSGERTYIPVQMLPGAPMVHYTSRGIEYDYGRHGITVGFGLLGRPKVTYRNRKPVGRQAKKAVAGVAGGAAQLVEATRLPELTRAAAEGTKNVVANTGNGIRDMGEGLIAPALQLIQATPLGSIFRSNPEEQATRRRDREVRSAAREASQAEAFIPSLR